MRSPASPRLQQWRNASFAVFRIVAVVEGITATGLFFVAMPLKYVFARPEAVSIAGLLHGYAFVAYVGLMIIALAGRRWPIRDWIRTFLASIVPLGTFINEPFLKRRHEATLACS